MENFTRTKNVDQNFYGN